MAAPEPLPRRGHVAKGGLGMNLDAMLAPSTLVLIRLYAYLGAFLGQLIALSFFYYSEDISNTSSICRDAVFT